MNDTLVYSAVAMTLGILVIVGLAWLEDRRAKARRDRREHRG